MKLKLRRALKVLGLLAIVGFLLANVVAYFHARSLVTYVEADTSTKRPEDLGGWERFATLARGVTVARPTNHTTPDQLDLPFENIELTATDGTELTAWFIPREESKGIVVMCHGYKASRSDVLWESRVLCELGWQVLALDFRGSGESDGNKVSLGYYEALDVAAAFDWVENAFPESKILAYGQSMGSSSILAAIDQKLIAPDGIMLESPFDRFSTTVRNRFDIMGIPKIPMSHFLLFWGGVQLGANAWKINPVEYAEQVDCPALVMIGQHDRYVRASEAESVARAMDAEFHVMEGCGHESYCRRNPVLHRQIVEGWIGRLNN